MLKGGIIKSQSSYNAPYNMIWKKSSQKEARMILDFRALNDKTIEDYPLLNCWNSGSVRRSTIFFSVCGLDSGFHQIKMDPVNSHKIAFTSLFGHEFERILFGLKNAPVTFQWLRDLILSQGEELFVYMSDIIIYDSIYAWRTWKEIHERKYVDWSTTWSQFKITTWQMWIF